MIVVGVFCCRQHRHHVIDGKNVEAKAAVPKGTGGSSNLTKKLFIGGTVSKWFLSAGICAVNYPHCFSF